MHCIEHSKRDRFEDSFRFMLEMSREIEDCKLCSIDPVKCLDGSVCDKTIVLPISTKYESISRISAMSRHCTELKECRKL